MVEVCATKHRTTVTIVKYGDFQGMPSTDSATSQQQAGQPTGNQSAYTGIKELKNERNNITYQQIADMFSETCVSFPRIAKLSEARKKAIRARMNQGYTGDDFKRLFELAESSSFLKGGNSRNWTATFDWLIGDANMAKVLDGNYADKPQEGGGADGTEPGSSAKLW